MHSRLHIAIKVGIIIFTIYALLSKFMQYKDLDFRTRRALFDSFTKSTQPFSSSDLDQFARKGNLNGRQIKNCVQSARALASNENKPLGKAHIMRVLDIIETFKQDIKGGTGYLDAMASYA